MTTGRRRATIRSASADTASPHRDWYVWSRVDPGWGQPWNAAGSSSTSTVGLVSAALTALGGTFYAYYQFYLQPNTVLSMHHSVDIMIRPIVGGSGTILGPMLGSFLLELLGEFSRTYFAEGAAGLSVLIYGLLLIAVVLFMPRGVYPTVLGWVRRALGRHA